MYRLAIWAGLVLASLVFPAEAGPRSALHAQCNILWPCAAPSASTPAQVRETRGRYVAREVGIGGPVRKAHRRVSHPRAGAIAGKPAGCPHAWCGCWLASHLGIRNKALNLARRWAYEGSPAGGPQPGAVVVWRHHVGLIRAVEGNKILVLSGNDGRAVRQRWRSTSGVIAYRRV